MNAGLGGRRSSDAVIKSSPRVAGDEAEPRKSQNQGKGSREEEACTPRSRAATIVTIPAARPKKGDYILGLTQLARSGKVRVAPMQKGATLFRHLASRVFRLGPLRYQRLRHLLWGRLPVVRGLAWLTLRLFIRLTLSLHSFFSPLVDLRFHVSHHSVWNNSRSSNLSAQEAKGHGLPCPLVAL